MKTLFKVAKNIFKGSAYASAIYLAYDKALTYYITVGAISDNGFDHNYVIEFAGAVKNSILSFI